MLPYHGLLYPTELQDDVQLQPVKSTGAYFVPEPRYKLRSEGEKILSGDHILIQSRRFVGSFVRLSAPLDPSPPPWPRSHLRPYA